MKIKIIDPITNQEGNLNSIGEVWVTGPTLFLGYIGQQPYHEDSYFATGDLGMVVKQSQDGQVTQWSLMGTLAAPSPPTPSSAPSVLPCHLLDFHSLPVQRAFPSTFEPYSMNTKNSRNWTVVLECYSKRALNFFLFEEVERLTLLLGRIKDLIISGGENIYAIEVEQVLAKHPNIKEIAVVGVQDQLFGERVKAYCVWHDTTSIPSELELINFCLPHLAQNKIPSLWETLQELPKTSLGKLDKLELRKMANAKQAGMCPPPPLYMKSVCGLFWAWRLPSLPLSSFSPVLFWLCSAGPLVPNLRVPGTTSMLVPCCDFPSFSPDELVSGAQTLQQPDFPETDRETLKTIILHSISKVFNHLRREPFDLSETQLYSSLGVTSIESVHIRNQILQNLKNTNFSDVVISSDICYRTLSPKETFEFIVNYKKQNLENLKKIENSKISENECMYNLPCANLLF